MTLEFINKRINEQHLEIINIWDRFEKKEITRERHKELCKSALSQLRYFEELEIINSVTQNQLT